MERRELLKWVGAGGAGAGAIAFLASLRDTDDEPSNPDRTTVQPTSSPATTTETAPSIPHAEEFGNVVDVVEAGLDLDTAGPINDFIEEYAADDTLLAFPAGTFQLEPISLSGYSHLGLTAISEEVPTFVPAGEECIEGGNSAIEFNDVQDLLVDSIDFEFPGDGSGGIIRVNAAGDVTIRNVSITGSCEAQVAQFRVDVLNPNATGVLENLRLDNRGEDKSLTGLYVGEHHAGTLVLRDCDVRGYSDNGLYASAAGLHDGQNGVVIVEGGMYRNNNISNVRLGTKGSQVKGVTVESVDRQDVHLVNVRGIRLRNQSGQIIEDSLIHIGPNSGSGFGAIVFHPENGGAKIRNSEIVVDKDEFLAINAQEPTGNPKNGPVFENVTISGEANGEFVAKINGRNGTVFRNCTIGGSGENRNGLRFSYSENCRIEDCRIDLSGDPIVLRQSSATVVNTTIVGPDGEERTIDEMEASDEDFTPR
ncbi:MAG: right-handed parallel beta-helix repeat-containing protein [Halobacteriota archaeon]